MNVSWKFWLFGVLIVVILEVSRSLSLLSQGYVWRVQPIEESLHPAYLVGTLIGYFIMVLIVAFSSAWIWRKIRKH